jgi:5'-nucleotidase/UDP-sugar diphosphatase
MNTSPRTLLCLLAAFLFTAIGTLAQTITILHVNDTHAHLDGFGPKNLHLEGQLGGIARAASVIFEQRATEPNVLLLHAGDIFHGDFFYNQKLGVPELSLMAALGFDAMAVGNHEFEITPDGLAMTLSTAFPDPATKPFPLLSANLDLAGYQTVDLSLWIQPSIVKVLQGVKVGIFGMTVFDDLQALPSPVVIDPNITGRAAQAIADLKAQGAQVIVCLSHLGIRYDRELAAGVAGIDFIVGGHDHYLLTKPEAVVNPDGKKTLIVQAGEFYEHIGKLRFAWDAGTQKVSFLDWRTIPVDKHVPEAPPIQAAVNELKKDVVAQYGRVYDRVDAWALTDLDKTYKPFSSLRDSPLGNLVTDAFRRKTGTQLAVTVAGFVSEKIYAGPIVGADVFRAMSYGYDPNGSGYGFRLATMKIQGAALIQALEITLAQLGVSDDFFPMVSGMTFKYDATRNPGERVVLESVRIGGRPFNPGALYTLTTNEAIPIILGMYGVPVSNLKVGKDFEYPVVREFIKKLTLVCYRPEGRIRDASAQCLPGEDATEEGEVVAGGSAAPSAPSVKQFALEDNYPNPFNPSTTIRYALPGLAQVSVKVFNSIGQEVSTLAEGMQPAGIYEVKWNAAGLASGVYFCRMTAHGENGTGNFSSIKKLMLVK